MAFRKGERPGTWKEDVLEQDWWRIRFERGYGTCRQTDSAVMMFPKFALLVKFPSAGRLYVITTATKHPLIKNESIGLHKRRNCRITHHVCTF